MPHTLALALVAILFALNVLDAILTDRVLANGGRERNPAVRWLLMQPLTYPVRWVGKLTIAVGLAWFIWTHTTGGWDRVTWLAIACAPFAYVCWHNWSQLQRQLARRGR